MKLTMVIADDEQLSLKSEEMLIRKEFPNIEIKGLAENGVVLKEMLETLKPDLAIVDIRMPGLSGLEVIELMRKKDCITHFIVNTAFSDFEYVKAALNLKTDGYLLKPAKREESIEVIARMCRTVEKQRKEEVKQQEIEYMLKVVNPTYESEIMASLISGTSSKEEFETYCRVNHIEFGKGCVISILSGMELNRKEIRHLSNKLHGILDEIGVFLFTITVQKIIILLILPQELGDHLLDLSCEIVDMIKGELGKSSGIDLKYGMGGIYASYDDMSKSYQESVHELEEQEIGIEVARVSANNVEQYIKRTCKYVQSHYQEDISLEDCARNIGISSYYLSHIFKEKTGQTLVEYLSEVRMNHAKQLCKDMTISIKDIAEQCGYSNLTYFYRVFKRATGMTIGEFRKEEANVKSK